MIKYLIGIIAFTALLMSCGGEEEVKKGDGEFYKTEVPEANVLRVGIKQLEDSLMQISQNQRVDKTALNLLQQAYIEKLKLLYRAYPEDKDAAPSLRKVYMTYSAIGAPELGAKYADSLIEKYPKFNERWMALESNAYYYDNEAPVRDKDKIRYYWEKLIAEYPNIDPEILERAKSRLETIDLTFDELIKMQN